MLQEHAMEARSVAEMQIVPHGTLGAAGAMLKLTEARSITPYSSITPYKWVHPDEER
jgi:hypothetical protein